MGIGVENSGYPYPYPPFLSCHLVERNNNIMKNI